MSKVNNVKISDKYLKQLTPEQIKEAEKFLKSLTLFSNNTGKSRSVGFTNYVTEGKKYKAFCVTDQITVPHPEIKFKEIKYITDYYYTDFGVEKVNTQIISEKVDGYPDSGFYSSTGDISNSQSQGVFMKANWSEFLIEKLGEDYKKDYNILRNNFIKNIIKQAQERVVASFKTKPELDLG